MADRDRDTNPDGFPAAKPDEDAERLKRDAASALRQTGEGLRRTGPDRAKLEEQRKPTPRAIQAPRRETLPGLPPPSGHPGDEPFGRPAGASLPPPSQDPKDARLAAMERELEAYRTGRKNSPSRGIPAQPGHTTADTTSDIPISDAAIGRGVRHLLRRFWPLLVGAAGLGAGGVGIAKPAASPAKTDAVAVELAALKRDHALAVEQLTGVLKREPARDAYALCLEETLNEVGEQLLPAQDRLGSSAPLRAYVKRCQRLRP